MVRTTLVYCARAAAPCNFVAHSIVRMFVWVRLLHMVRTSTVLDSYVLFVGSSCLCFPGDSFFSGGAVNGTLMESGSESESEEEDESSEEDSDEDEAMSGDESEPASSGGQSKSLVFPSAAWKSQQLATLCVDTLQLLFRHDSKNKLVHRQVFEQVMPPLVDQVSL